MNKKSVVLDYGHGGSDPGAVSGKHIERNYNLDTGLACAKELRAYGVKVYETRTNNSTTLSLNQRCAIANSKDAYYFVSIHHNAGGGDRGETIHSIYGGDSANLAKSVAEELKKVGQTYVKTYSRSGSNGDYYAVIRGTRAKAIIVECAFLDNAKDVQFVDTLAERQRNGVAIAHGILKEMGIKVGVDCKVEEVEVLYKVRKSWEDGRSQIGAFRLLADAKAKCDTKPGYSVYNSNGKLIYTNTNDFLVRVVVPELNVRKGAGMNFPIVTTVRKGSVFTITEVKGEWGRLKSGAGWVNISTKYIAKRG